MQREAYRDEIKLQLSGGLLELEIDDETIDKIINAAFREIQRYIDTTYLITIPYSPCIDLSDYKINSISQIYRANGYMVTSGETTGMVDPMYAAQWQLLSGAGGLYNTNNFALNIASYNTLLQMRNTLSTDLAFYYDPIQKKLYINQSSGNIDKITIEYVPKFDDVSEVTSDFWIDMIMRLSVALAKIAVGRIRSRFTQSSALWSQDGQTLLDEGKAELSDLRDRLVASTSLNYPID